ncbi:MAG: molybdate ABC transporter substrate-binding protein [Rhodobacteraceae bacterium]|nr:molybdate ABC transporter substrate-binding protein [Paracoccaceae bacterium]
MRLALAAALLIAAAPALADSALIAVATNFRPVAEILAGNYAAVSGNTVEISAGATAKLAQQIGAGAPFDAFLSADAATPTRLAGEGAADPATQFTYATGRLALWTAAGGADLTDPAGALTAARHVAIANPEVAPYGKAAMETIGTLGLSGLGSKLVMGENIGQTQTLVASGAAEIGFVAASGLVGAGGTSWLVPQEAHSPIRQDAILLIHGTGNAAATGFLAYLRSEAARQVIEDYGYAAAP